MIKSMFLLNYNIKITFKKANFLFTFRYIIAGLSTGCLIVFNVNFNVLTYRRKATQ
jgi:hypothetical protein